MPKISRQKYHAINNNIALTCQLDDINTFITVNMIQWLKTLKTLKPKIYKVFGYDIHECRHS